MLKQSRGITMNNAIQELQNCLAMPKPEYSGMLKNIQQKLPQVSYNTSNFYKSHSQFMGVMLDVTAITAVRSIKHTLAEIEQTRMALQEAYIKVRKQDIIIKSKEHKLQKLIANNEDEYDVEMLQVEILEEKLNRETAQNYINGAIRKLNFFVNQHNNLLKKIGKTNITEEDYEKEETRYHIMTCMKQALNAARARNGMIDEGNLIYLFDLGINAAHAQEELKAYLLMEQKLIADGRMPTHEITMRWLEACADLWASSPAKFAERRGFALIDYESLTNRDGSHGADH